MNPRRKIHSISKRAGRGAIAGRPFSSFDCHHQMPVDFDLRIRRLGVDHDCDAAAREGASAVLAIREYLKEVG